MIRCAFSILFLSIMAHALCVEEAGSRIIDGVRVDPSDYPTVASIFCTDPLTGEQSKGTGTLITKHHILTAGHVIHGQLAFYTTVTVNGAAYSPIAMFEHPFAQAPFESKSDLGIIVLSEEVPVNPSPIIVTGPDAYSLVEIVGYGHVRGSDNFYTNYLYRGFTSYETVGSTHVFWKFDALESNTAHGDSGGPAFISVGGQKCISSITEGGETEDLFGSLSWNARVDNQIGWIELITQEPVLKAFLLTKPESAKVSFAANLTKSSKDSLSITMSSKDLIGKQLPISQTCSVSLGGVTIDTFTMLVKTGIGNGKLTVNTRSGQLKYALKKGLITGALAAQGITGNTSGLKDLLLFIGINGKLYGASYKVSVSSRPGKSIKGKLF